MTKKLFFWCIISYDISCGETSGSVIYFSHPQFLKKKMPPKKRSFFGLSKKTKALKRKRQDESEEERNLFREQAARRMASLREAEDEEQRNIRRSYDARRAAAKREAEDEEQKKWRRVCDARRAEARREAEDENQRTYRLEINRQRIIFHRSQQSQEEAENIRHIDRVRHAEDRARPFNAEYWLLGAFSYNEGYCYDTHPLVQIGRMSQQCNYCQAKKFINESPGLCCREGKIMLPLLADPPEPLKQLVDGTSPHSKIFLERIRLYNNAFQMTSFGAKFVNEGGFMPTFKIQGQIYHCLGSILPMHDDNHKFLQVYFISNVKTQAEMRCIYNNGINIDVVQQLQQMLHNNNTYVRSFKYALENIQNSEYQFVINADTRPPNEHARRFNAPEVNEVAMILAGEQCGKRDIIIKFRDNKVQRIYDTHRSYDALQYPLLFPGGQDGYHFGIPQSRENSRKTVSCMDFYAFYLMIRPNNFNLLHRSRELFQQLFY